LNVSDYVLSLGLLQSSTPELKLQQFRVCPLFPLVCNGQDYGTQLKQAASTFTVMVNAFKLWYYPQSSCSNTSPHNCCQWNAVSFLLL